MQLGTKVLLANNNQESVSPMGRALIERYRCPAGFFDFSLHNELSSYKGYFRFGQNVTCYGRSSSKHRALSADSSLEDLSADVSVKDGKLALPFDPTEVIDNLRMERYQNEDNAKEDAIRFLRRIYYLFRPLMSNFLRSQIQRFHARNWKKLIFPCWPVDTTVEDFCEKLLLLSMQAKGVDRVPFIWFWPNGAKASLCMTHDVETEAGRSSCAALMDLDESYGIKASFQLIPEERYVVSPEFRKMILDRGFGIAVHGLKHDSRLYNNRQEFLRSAKKINEYAREYGAKGFRAAVMYRNPEWYGAFDFSFDMSIPNVAHLDPQRGGCCTVMPYFIGDILEIPVTAIQDYMLFHLLKEHSIDLWRQQCEIIIKKHGMMSFIVHPDYLTPYNRPVYIELLSYLRELQTKSQIWIALPEEIDEWWRARSKMRLEKNGTSWRITGEKSESAMLVYARNFNGSLVYETESGKRITSSL